jgi:uncharacterized membrane protein YjfL (UPF0719 family)
METELVNWHNVAGALIYSLIGLIIYIFGFIALNLLTPQVHIWREINEEKNVAIAIFLGCIALGIAIIIGSAVRG